MVMVVKKNDTCSCLKSESGRPACSQLAYRVTVALICVRVFKTCSLFKLSSCVLITIGSFLIYHQSNTFHFPLQQANTPILSLIIGDGGTSFLDVTNLSNNFYAFYM